MFIFDIFIILVFVSIMLYIGYKYKDEIIKLIMPENTNINTNLNLNPNTNTNTNTNTNINTNIKKNINPIEEINLDNISQISINSDFDKESKNSIDMTFLD